MGIVRYENSLRLLVLHYDKSFSPYTEQEAAYLCKKIETNRESLSKSRESCTPNIFMNARILKAGEILFEINGAHSLRCDLNNWETALMLYEFLRKGWKPSGIDSQNIENLFLTSLSLSGEYAVMPDLGETPSLQFSFDTEHKTHLIEQPLTLSVNSGYPEKLNFKSRITEKEYTVYINRVYLLDMWQEITNTLNSPSLKAQFTEEELEQRKKDFEKSFSDICPKGKYLPIIEYECAEDISLQFHLRSFLDNKIEERNSATVGRNALIGFIVPPERKTGISELPLKTSVIQEPMEENTAFIEAELFSFSEIKKKNDLIL